MRLLLSVTGVGLGALTLPSAFPAPQSVQSTLPVPVRSTTNLLGNGGFEGWTNGHAFQGPIGPDLWLAMGDPSDVFTQADVAFTRVQACPPSGSGSTAAQMRANLPENFVSQSLGNFAELAGLEVTFSTDVHPLFPLANARLEIDDGVTTTSAAITVQMGQWGRVTVRHTVAACPGKLEFRIYPEQTIDVDNAMAVVGRRPSADFVPSGNLDPHLREVPLGTVMDWYRFDAAIPVPEGFAICDGSPVVDPFSPYLGRATPDLADRFVRGVTSVGGIGAMGGSETHGHGSTSVNHGGYGSPSGDYWFMSSGQFDNLHNARDGHTHTVGSSNHLPPYMGLLKIVRVR